jgi:hypothetical protein
MRKYLLLAMAVGASFIGSNCGGSGIGDPCVPEDEYVQTFGSFSVDEVNVESRSFQCLTRVCLGNHFQGRVSCPYGQSSETAGKDNKETGFAYCSSCGNGETAGDCCDDAANPSTSARIDGEAGACTPYVTGTSKVADPAKAELIGRNDDACNPGGAKHATSCRIPERDGSDQGDRVKVTVKAQLAERTADKAVYCSCRCDGPDPNARYCECPSGFLCEELIKDQGLGKGQLAGSYCVKEGTEYNPTKKPTALCSNGAANCGSVVELESGIRYGVNPPNPDILSEDEASAE